MDGSFFSAENMGNVVMKNYSSFRCSDIGYWNDFMPLLEYSSLNEYIDDIQRYVDEGQIIAPAELYYPVRLKPKGENTLENLKKSGVNHIEIRVLDLNPLSEVGIMKEDIEFLHIMMVYLMYSECDEFSHSEQIAAIKNLKRAAEYDDEKILIETGWNSGKPIKSAALEFIDDVEAFCRRFQSPYSADCIEYQRDKIVHPQNRYAVRIRNMFGENYVQRGLNLSQNYVKAIKEARGNV